MPSRGAWSNFLTDDFSPMVAEVSDNDVYETAKEVVVKVNVADVPSDKINVTLDKGILSINADQTIKKDDKKKNFQAQSSWSYSYQVVVPGHLDSLVEPDVVVKNGVIVVKFKKALESSPKKLKIRTE